MHARLTLLISVTVLAATAGLGLQASMATAAASSGCADVWYIGARGSGEPAQGFDGMGAAVDHMYSVLSADLASKGLTVSPVADAYSADPVTELLPNAEVKRDLRSGNLVAAAAVYIRTSVNPYLASIQQGIAGAEKAVHTVLAKCPKARIVMAGYSQGAIAIHDAENYLAGKQHAEFSHIAGTLLLGDPDRVPHTKAKLFGSSTAGAQGLRVRLGLVSPHDVPDPATTANIANADDIVGDFKLSHLLHAGEAVQVHEDYAVTKNGKTTYEPVLGDAANWVASQIGTARTVSLPKSSWHPVGGATISGHKDGTFDVVYDPTYWGGVIARHDAGCSYLLTGGGRVRAGGGYGPTAWARIDKTGTPHGQSIQYDLGIGGYRNVNLPNGSETGPVHSAPVNYDWHTISIQVFNGHYVSSVDGAVIFKGAMPGSCTAGVFIRLWNSADVQFRDWTITPVNSLP
jgi:hypothetical protein